MHLQLLDLNDQNVQRVHQLFCMPQVYRYLADDKMPPQSVAEDWLASSRPDWKEFGGGFWALKSIDTGDDFLGLARLANYAGRQVELTYLLHPSKWHKGLATQMAHSVMDVCFRRGRVLTIWAGADKPNVESIAVLRRLGMRFRRETDYPAGKGVEYEISVEEFVQDRMKCFEAFPS